MTTNRKATARVAQDAKSGIFTRTRLSLANSARSLQTRKRITFELELLNDRALADIGLWRCDISQFARDAGRIPGAESLAVALLADLRSLWQSGRPASAARQLPAKSSL